MTAFNNSSSPQPPYQLPLRPKFTQDWVNYNAAQCEEKSRFITLLADLCQHVPDPEYTLGRPRLPLGDMAFSIVYKVYSGFAARRFTSDLNEARAKGIVAHTPHFTSTNNYMRDLILTPILTELVTLSSTPLAAVETKFAIDSSGFSTSKYMTWNERKWGKYTGRKYDRREWVKCNLMCGVNTNIVTGVEVSGWATADTRYFEPLLKRTAEYFKIDEVSADKAYLSRKNMDLVNSLGGTPYIPFKENTVPQWKQDSVWAKMYYRYMWDRSGYMQHYHLRSNVESTFGAIKAKFGNAVRSKHPVGQVNEVLCKVLCHNICTVIKETHALGITPNFHGTPVL